MYLQLDNLPFTISAFNNNEAVYSLLNVHSFVSSRMNGAQTANLYRIQAKDGGKVIYLHE